MVLNNSYQDYILKSKVHYVNGSKVFFFNVCFFFLMPQLDLVTFSLQVSLVLFFFWTICIKLEYFSLTHFVILNDFKVKTWDSFLVIFKGFLRKIKIFFLLNLKFIFLSISIFLNDF